MREYVTACASHENAARTREVLDRIVVDPRLHARFVNTLSRLEYVGVRKILKSRRSERLDIDGLQHILDEAVLDLPAAERAEANYHLTSAAIEVRAQVFYPLYDRCLQENAVGFSVAA